MSYLRHLARNFIYIVMGTLVAYLLFKYLAPAFSPFIIAVFLTFFIEPMVTFLQQRVRMPRAAAVGVAMIGVFGGLGVVLSLAVTRLIVELLHLSTFLPEYIENIKSVALSMQTRVEDYYFKLPQDVLLFVNRKIAGSEYSLDSILDKAKVITGKLLNLLLQLVSSVPAWVILIIISAIATYFMAKDRRLIVSYWLRSVPEPWGRKSLDITKEIMQAIISYIRVQLILISITLLQSMVGLYIIGAPYALLMGLAIGLADVIPILGPSSIYLPWIAWEFITGDSVFAIKLTVLYVVVLVVRQILETKIVSSSMGLHPLATLMAMYVGLQMLGPLGVVAGPLFIITLKAFASAGLIGWKEKTDPK